MLKNIFQLSKRYFHHSRHFHQSLAPHPLNSNYNVGDKIYGYCIKDIKEISELNLTAIHLEHKATGADHLHIARNDEENCFSVALRTPPTNSTGVPHILEHLALCGSKKFPCRDPFFNMLNRSLSTFMNAFTGNDYTMYVFSSQNAKDFANLLSVYLDAVYYPLLNEKDFRQEGWRLEHENIHDKNSPIVLKGVVFNEMKGVFSDSNQYYVQVLQNELYPSTTYSFVSGGDPLIIPQLSLEELRAFHSTHYHPSNSRFFTYGNMPLESHLEYIENNVLHHFQKINIDNKVSEEKRWSSPKEVHISTRYDPMAAIPDKQTTISASYLLNNITDTYESFALSILSALLIDGPNAPFYQSLLESGIGSDFSPCVGYDAHQKEGLFSIGLREISANDVNKVKDIIESTFNNVIKTGFPRERILGILHNVELSTKHQKSKFGLSCAMAINSMWNHNGNPLSALRVNHHVKWFTEQLDKNPHFLQDKILQYFKGNNHKLTLIMSPHESFDKEMKQKEQALLESKISNLNEITKTQIYDDGLDLFNHQQQEPNVECLPSLQISDVEKKIEKTTLKLISFDNVRVQLCEQPTNEIVYFKAVSSLHDISEDLLLLLPLFSSIATRMGAGNRNYKEFDQEVELKTGGLGISVHISEHPLDLKKYEMGLIFSSYCLEKNVNDMFNLWEDVFNRIHLEDLDRLKQLIKMSAADLAQGIPHHGHLYSMRKASSCLNECCTIKEKLSGLNQVSYMKKLAEMNNYEEIMDKLKMLSKMILNKKKFRCAINATAVGMSPAVQRLESFVNSLSLNSIDHHPNEIFITNSHTEQTHFILPYLVNYLGKSILTVPYGHEDFSKLRIASRLLSLKYLHREIREKGGAYGGGASISSGGVFNFYSYRDPHVTNTLDSFNSGCDWLIEGNFSDRDIDEAKLGIFSEIDKPITSGAKGSLFFLNNISDEMKQELRERIFACSKMDLIYVTEKYLKNSGHYGIALIGPENDLTKNDSWILHKEE